MINDMEVLVDKKTKEQLTYLSFSYLQDNWSHLTNEAVKREWSVDKLLKFLVNKEYEVKQERSRVSRIKAAKIPIEYTIETYPFAEQNHLNRKRLLANYDSLNYIHEKRNMILMGPTGTGKTGLATAFLLNAINQGFRGRFITFSDLIDELWASQADGTGQKVLNKFAAYHCLVVDELGYLKAESAQVGLFFTLMQKRYKKTTTMITTNLSFQDWESYLGHKQLAAALIDRLTDNGHVINMVRCKSMRKDADVD
jgi:DNA replication protein DnaC